jgi:hypothetical protein
MQDSNDKNLTRSRKGPPPTLGTRNTSGWGATLQKSNEPRVPGQWGNSPPLVAPKPSRPAAVKQFYARQLSDLDQTGEEWRGPCPVHGGHRNAFAVDPATGAWS